MGSPPLLFPWTRGRVGSPPLLFSWTRWRVGSPPLPLPMDTRYSQPHVPVPTFSQQEEGALQQGCDQWLKHISFWYPKGYLTWLFAPQPDRPVSNSGKARPQVSRATVHVLGCGTESQNQGWKSLLRSSNSNHQPSTTTVPLKHLTASPQK